MLLFYAAPAARLPAIRYDGLRGDVRLQPTLEAARQEAAAENHHRVLVIDAAWLSGVAMRAAFEAEVRVEAVPPAALCNLDPYRAPVPVEAGGGYVVRPGAEDSEGPEVLLIYRRGAWDLPKGKRDAGETVEECALREVHEEIGARLGPGGLRLVRALGPTVHGYAHKDGYAVKTTHWFLMHTPQEGFTPEAREGIEAVAWVAWREAQERLSYASLRQHIEKLSGADLLKR